jgi:serine/arginine repetitive matrix protein 1
MASSVDEKLLKSTKFPAEFNQKVDMQKVNIEVMKKYVTAALHGLRNPVKLTYRRWIAGKISKILGAEDDVVIELCFNLLEGTRYVS